MRHLAIGLLVVLAISATAPAQTQTPFDKTFQEGYDALVAKKFDEGIAAFKRCLEIRPEHSTCAYNLACGYSLKKEADPAIEWFGKAVDWGFCNGSDRIDLVNKDTDLEFIRKDARFTTLLDDVKKRLVAAADYSNKPAFYIPKSLEGKEPIPLLIVLHADGANKDDVIKGPWKNIADKFGYALLAPSGPLLHKKEPKEGMAWFDDYNNFARKYWSFEKTVHDGVDALRKKHKVDEKRVFIAGEGNGGMVAFNVAVRGTGLYKGVIVVDGLVHLRLASARGAKAGQRGLRAAMVVNAAGKLPGLPQKETKKYLRSTLDSWKTWGIKSEMKTYGSKEPNAPTRQDVLIGCLKSFVPGPAKTEGADSKPSKSG